MHIITKVENGGIFKQMGVEEGDALLELNGKKIKDVFDYRFLAADEYVEALIRKKNGEEWLLEIEKDESEDLGADFSEPMMDKPKSCGNRCIFCFIDQLPGGMRTPLYFKDDDARLSFLKGNYVTLTNIGQKELDRLIYYKLSPLNVSVHTTDPDLRVKMLRNKNAGNIIERLSKISGAGIEINCQIVLVKGVNDGKNLKQTISDLIEIDGVKSVSAVPVGLTRHREGLTPLEPFQKEDALAVLGIIHEAQEHTSKKKGTRFVYAADELYLKAGKDFPKYEDYDGFPQLENGVGMTVLFESEFGERLLELQEDKRERKVTVVTGKIAEPVISKLSKKFTEKFTNTEIKVIMVENRFLGEEITVSGLITGRDILAALKENNIKGRVLLPSNCMKDGTSVFLDDMSVEDLNNALKTEAVAVGVDGGEFADALFASVEQRVDR